MMLLKVSAVGSLNHEEVEDKAFFRQQEESSGFQALVLLGTSATPVSSEETMQEGISSPGDFLCAFMAVSLHR